MLIHPNTGQVYNVYTQDMTNMSPTNTFANIFVKISIFVKSTNIPYWHKGSNTNLFFLTPLIQYLNTTNTNNVKKRHKIIFSKDF